MGSLASRPKIPATYQPQIVAPSQPIQTPVDVQDIKQPIIMPSESVEIEENIPAISDTNTQVRLTNLLRRNRGVLGPIQTGFRGLLSSNQLVPERKTLLGE